MKQAAWIGAAVVLAGCGAAPVARPAVVAETAVSMKRPAAAKPAGKAAATATAGLAMSAATAARTAPAAPTVAAAAPEAAGPAAAGPLAAAPEAAPATARVTAAPRVPVRVFPMRDVQGAVVDFRMDPPTGVVTWQIEAPAAGLMVSKAKYAFTGVDAPVTCEVDAKDLGWPARLAGPVALPVSFNLYDTGALLDGNREATRFQATVTLLDAAGHEVPGPDGAPLALTTSIAIQ